MSFPSFIRASGLFLLLLATAPVFANGLASAKLRPSDCRPRDSDSTCATAVAGATVTIPPFNADHVLYDGPLGGVSAFDHAYWGFDFIADETGAPSPVRGDEFINRSNVPVTITFTFEAVVGCKGSCLPSMHFQADAGWHRIYPPLTFDAGRFTSSATFRPGQGYGWVVAQWEPGNLRLTVTVPNGSGATLRTVGLSPLLALATEIPRVVTQCDCLDGTAKPCSAGSRFSNGLLGPWSEADDTYERAGAFGCPVNH